MMVALGCCVWDFGREGMRRVRGVKGEIEMSSENEISREK
jgi:hypothetical protein